MRAAQATLTLNWRKAVKISCCLHLLLVSATGVAATSWLHSELPAEHFVEVELGALALSANTAEPSVAAKQPILPQTATTAAGVKRAEQAAGEKSSRVAAMPSNGDGQSYSNMANKAAAAIERGGGAAGVGVSAGDSKPNIEEPGETAGGNSEADRLAVIEEFLSRVEAHKEYPYMALKRNLQGRPIITVALAADGSLQAADVVVSSGVASLDKAALQAVQSACPFAHGLGEPLQLNVPVSYRLGGS